MLIDNTVVVQHTDDLQIVPQTNLKVIGVMGGSHLDAAGAEFHFGIVISNHGDLLVHQRQDHLLADDVLVTLVVGVDTDAGIAQHSFRTGGRNNNFAGAVSQRIADMPQIAGLVTYSTSASDNAVTQLGHQLMMRLPL